MTHQPVIVSTGEVLWDLFPDGPRFGGAPANFACHLAALGPEVFMVSRVGDDELGQKAIVSLRDQHNVSVALMKRSSQHPTGTVQVDLDQKGKPKYTIHRNAAWDHIESFDELEQISLKADAVYFGTLSQRSPISKQTIQGFVNSTPDRVIRVLDVNLRTPFFDKEIIDQSLKIANVLKLNDDELPLIASMYDLSGSVTELIAHLIKQFDLRLVALTCGEKGALLMDSSGELSECQGEQIQVKDTVGAGDAFTAAVILGLLKKQSLETINQFACKLAAYICTQSGATPDLPQNFRSDS